MVATHHSGQGYEFQLNQYVSIGIYMYKVLVLLLLLFCYFSMILDVQVGLLLDITVMYQSNRPLKSVSDHHLKPS